VYFLVTRQESTKETRPEVLTFGFPENAFSRAVAATGLPAPGPLNPHPGGLTPSKTPFPASFPHGGDKAAVCMRGSCGNLDFEKAGSLLLLTVSSDAYG